MEEVLVPQTLDLESAFMKRIVLDQRRVSLHAILSQTCESMSGPLECGDLPTVYVNPEASFEPVRDTIQALRERIEDVCNQELCKITKQGQTQEAFLVRPLSIFGVVALVSIVSSLFFQPMTPHCSHWETVSSEKLVFS